MSKLEVKQISGFGGRILCQMISRRDGIETLNELCNCGTVRVRRVVAGEVAELQLILLANAR